MHVAAARACGELRPQHGCEQTGPRAKGSAGDANSSLCTRKAPSLAKTKEKAFLEVQTFVCHVAALPTGREGMASAGLEPGTALLLSLQGSVWVPVHEQAQFLVIPSLMNPFCSSGGAGTSRDGHNTTRRGTRAIGTNPSTKISSPQVPEQSYS